MTSDGTPWRPLVHIEDICQAIILALEAPREAVHNEIFNVGDDEQNYRSLPSISVRGQTTAAALYYSSGHHGVGVPSLLYPERDSLDRAVIGYNLTYIAC
jgi:UDP-glucose 4-epimerase